MHYQEWKVMDTDSMAEESRGLMDALQYIATISELGIGSFA